ncbi:hypothetical protein CERSUDRAFT_74868 [Gelatoporia subvermispora B]|uniref:Uncharacterized protein n=1 Tax=Ceriporiopsis subvermispora (strain B) TaxID=914234 RepID=M2RCH6_CERS8|nr:hypothetical protein CERSUDRAFT_74868 [Gelatoporia subvermispora B]
MSGMYFPVDMTTHTGFYPAGATIASFPPADKLTPQSVIEAQAAGLLYRPAETLMSIDPRLTWIQRQPYAVGGEAMAQDLPVPDSSNMSGSSWYPHPAVAGPSSASPTPQSTPALTDASTISSTRGPSKVFALIGWAIKCERHQRIRVRLASILGYGLTTYHISFDRHRKAMWRLTTQPIPQSAIVVNGATSRPYNVKGRRQPSTTRQSVLAKPRRRRAIPPAGNTTHDFRKVKLPDARAQLSREPCSCGAKVNGRRKHKISDHFWELYQPAERQDFRCPVEGCHSSMEWCSRQRHVDTIHMQAGPGACDICGKIFDSHRVDSIKRHRSSGTCTGSEAKGSTNSRETS